MRYAEILDEPVLGPREIGTFLPPVNTDAAPIRHQPTLWPAIWLQRHVLASICTRHLQTADALASN
jgi:hypothetical protein